MKYIKRSIETYDSSTQLDILKEVCNKIYIARNIIMSEEMIIEQLERIDTLFRNDENFN